MTRNDAHTTNAVPIGDASRMLLVPRVVTVIVRMIRDGTMNSWLSSAVHSRSHCLTFASMYASASRQHANL